MNSSGELLDRDDGRESSKRMRMIVMECLGIYYCDGIKHVVK